MGKLETPAWIKEGYDSPAEWKKAKGIKDDKNKGKTFNEKEDKKVTQKVKSKLYKVKICPKCGSDNVGVVLNGEEGKGSGEWECRKCKWKGVNIEKKELNEDEFLKIMEKE